MSKSEPESSIQALMIHLQTQALQTQLLEYVSVTRTGNISKNQFPNRYWKESETQEDLQWLKLTACL